MKDLNKLADKIQEMKDPRDLKLLEKEDKKALTIIFVLILLFIIAIIYAVAYGIRYLGGK